MTSNPLQKVIKKADWSLSNGDEAYEISHNDLSLLIKAARSTLDTPEEVDRMKRHMERCHHDFDYEDSLAGNSLDDLESQLMAEIGEEKMCRHIVEGTRAIFRVYKAATQAKINALEKQLSQLNQKPLGDVEAALDAFPSPQNDDGTYKGSSEYKSDVFVWFSDNEVTIKNSLKAAYPGAST